MPKDEFLTQLIGWLFIVSTVCTFIYAHRKKILFWRKTNKSKNDIDEI